MVRLTIVEWCLVTILYYGTYDFHIKTKFLASNRLRDFYFNSNLDTTLKQFDENFENLNFNDIYDIDALNIALYYFADRVFNERKDELIPNPLLLNYVDDLEYFRILLWGYLS